MSSAFQLIADKTRRQLLIFTNGQKKTVNELVELMDLSQPAVSKQLRLLHNGGLMTRRKKGKFRLYQTNEQGLQEILNWLLKFDQLWTNKLDALEDYLDEM